MDGRRGGRGGVDPDGGGGWKGGEGVEGRRGGG